MTEGASPQRDGLGRWWPLLAATILVGAGGFWAARRDWRGATGTVDRGHDVAHQTTRAPPTPRVEVARGWVGWAVKDLPRGGVWVAAVYSGGPADKAGVEKGDVITSVNGDPATRASIVAAIRSRSPGATLEFERTREDGTRDSVFVTIERSSGIDALIAETLRSGAQALAGLQTESGLWPHFQAPERTSVATSALACAALALAGPEGGEDAALARGLDALAARRAKDGGLDDAFDPMPHRVYANAFYLLALSRTDRARDLEPTRSWLARVQIGGEGWEWVDPLDTRYGGWSYHEVRTSSLLRADVSVASWALDALAASGLEASRAEWARAGRFLERCQNRDLLACRPEDRSSETPFRDGGFAFAPAAGKAGREAVGEELFVGRSYGSATADGLRGLLATSGEDFDRDRRDAALQWLARSYALDRNPGFPENDAAGWSRGIFFYWLASLARALDAAHVDRIERANGVHAWPDELARVLANSQRKGGGWRNDSTIMGEDSPVVATSFALVALSAALGRVRAKDGRALVAAASPPPPPPAIAPWAPDAPAVERGRLLFRSPALGCTGCHQDSAPTNGPSLVGVADRYLEWKKTHEEAREYLRRHIRDSDSYPGTHSRGWPAKMPHFGDASGLDDAKLGDVVEFLLSRSGRAAVSEAR